MYSLHSRWSIAIFAARETPAILESAVRGVIVACEGRDATIDVLINGNSELAKNFSQIAKTIEPGNCKLRVWSIAAPDKAHTWNEYVHRIHQPGTTAFFIDGYVRVRPDALVAIDRRLATTPGAWGATGVPTSGHSAKKLRETMLRQGGIHGNLYAVTLDSMHAIRKTGFRLPLGLYRTDPLLGSALVYQLDPANNEWKPDRIAVESGATWDVDGISELTIKNMLGQLKRKLRQAQGELENRAAREHMAVRRLPPHLLSATSQEMISNWLNTKPAQARSLFLRHPLCIYAAWQLRNPRNWETTKIPPLLILTRDGAAQVDTCATLLAA